MLFISWRILLSMLYGLVTVCMAQKPIITEHPETTYGLKLQKTFLNCKANPPSANISWYKDGSLVESYLEKPVSSNRLVEKNRLTFLTLESGDEGVYYCNASTSLGWTVSRNVSVRIAFLGEGISGPRPRQVASVGETVVLACTPPRGEPPPIVAWEKDGDSLAHSSRVRVLPGGSLRIERVRREDAGRYRCTARTLSFSRESAEGQLLVWQKPRFTMMPRGDVKVEVGASLELPCQAEGDPTPVIRWRRKGPLPPPANSLIESRSTSLRIPHVTKDDGGRYVCQAISKAGRMEAEVEVLVLVRPTFLETPSDTTVREGAQVTLACLASGSPAPSVLWSHYGDVFMRGETQTRISVSRKGSLVIQRARPQDSGRYKCSASSSQGQVHASAVLEVTRPADLAPALIPVIEVPPHNQTLAEGLTATFLCQPRSTTRTSITWLRDGVPLDGAAADPRVILLNDGPLKINQVRRSDTAKYTCRVRSTQSSGSREGTTEWDSYLRVVSSPHTQTQQSPPPELLPAPLVQLEVVDRGPRHLKLSWSGSTPMGALVQWHPPGARAWSRSRLISSSVPVRLGPLRPGTGYRVLVRAINSHGVSKPALLTGGIAYTLPPSTATQLSLLDMNTIKTHLSRVQIINFQYKSVSRNSMTLKWQVNGSPNDRKFISGYEVRYQEVPLSRCIDHTTTNGGSDPSPQQTRPLSPSSSSSLQHCSLNLMPNLSPSQTRRDIDLWSGTSGKEMLKLVRNSVSARRFNSAPDSMLILLMKLRPFQCYEVYVRHYADHKKYGRIKSDTRSNAITVLTYDTEPSGAPRNLRATWITNSSLRLDWSSPDASLINGILTGYSLYVIGRITNNTRSIELSAGSAHTIIRDLSRRHSYVIHMSARNCQGEGVRTRGLYIPPSVPMGLVVELKEDDSSSLGANKNTGNSNNRRRSYSDGQIDGDQTNLVQQPWFISILVVGILLWVLVCSVVVMVCRGMYIRGLLYKSTGYSGGIKDANGYLGNGGIGQPNSSTVTKDTVVIMTPLISSGSNNSQTVDTTTNFYSNNHTTTNTNNNNMELMTNNNNHNNHHTKLNGLATTTGAVANINPNHHNHHHQRRFMDSGTDSTSSNHSTGNPQNSSNLIGQEHQNGLVSSNVEPYATASLIQQQCSEQAGLKDHQTCYPPPASHSTNHNSGSGSNGIPPPPSFPPPPAPPFSCSGSSVDDNEDDENEHHNQHHHHPRGNNGPSSRIEVCRDEGNNNNDDDDDDGGSYASCPNDDEDDGEEGEDGGHKVAACDRGLIAGSADGLGTVAPPSSQMNVNFHAQMCSPASQHPYYWQPSQQQNPLLHNNHSIMLPTNHHHHHQIMLPANHNVSQSPYQQHSEAPPPLIPLPVPGSWYMDYSCSPRLFPATTSVSSNTNSSSAASDMNHAAAATMSHLFPPPPMTYMSQQQQQQ